MFEVCLFDLDQTLVDTLDMTALRESGKGRDDASYVAEVKRAFGDDGLRLIYSEELLSRIRTTFPETKLGVFTRSPRRYAETVLSSAYPAMTWDVVVAYEDVEKTKPHGEGIDKAMWSFGYERISKVVLVGDGDADVRSAYNAGCVAVLDRTSWDHTYSRDNWKALSWLPDAVIDRPEDIIDVLRHPRAHLPELERLLSKTSHGVLSKRFDRINKFIPKVVGGDTTAYPIHACGRSFAGYASLEWSAKGHRLTKSILEHKDATTFPDEWVQAIRSFITKLFPPSFATGDLVVSVIPHRPGRTPRLENLLTQVEASIVASPLPGRLKLSFVPDLLAYRAGVRSNSNDRLGANDRFLNVRDHLHVARERVAAGARVLVIDDVSTTGASLIYARKYLMAAAAVDVTCLTIAMNISNVLYE